MPVRFVLNGGDVQYSDGTRWVTVSAVDDPVVLEVATSRPTAPFVGETILNSTTGKVETWNGSFWMQLN